MFRIGDKITFHCYNFELLIEGYIKSIIGRTRHLPDGTRQAVLDIHISPISCSRCPQMKRGCEQKPIRVSNEVTLIEANVYNKRRYYV